MTKALTPQAKEAKKAKAAATRAANKAAKAAAEAEGQNTLPTEPEPIPGEVIEEDKPKSKVKYWASPTMIPTIGVVKGIIKAEHWQRFCQVATNPTTQKRFVVDYDPEVKRKKNAKEAIAKRLGIRD